MLPLFLCNPSMHVNRVKNKINFFLNFKACTAHLHAHIVVWLDLQCCEPQYSKRHFLYRLFPPTPACTKPLCYLQPFHPRLNAAWIMKDSQSAVQTRSANISYKACFFQTTPRPDCFLSPPTFPKDTPIRKYLFLNNTCQRVLYKRPP